MIRYLICLILIIFFTGCSSKKALDGIDKNSFFSNALPHTFKCDISNENEVDVMFTATYLNSINKEYRDGRENFIVGVYIAQREQDKKEFFYLNKNFNILLNDTEYLSLEPINKNSEVLKNLPLYDPWAEYFNVNFNTIKVSLPYVKANTVNVAEGEQLREQIPVAYNLKLELKHEKLGACSIKFAKK